MSYPPSQKPPIWSIDPGVIAYNCQKAGMPHPVLAMPMWEGAGNLARDYSGHGNHGTINGADWVAGGLDFVTTNGDYVEAPTADDNIDLTQPWTISCLFKITSYSSYAAVAGFNYNSGIEYLTIGHDDSDPPKFKIATNGKTPGTGSTLSTDTLYHGVLVWDGAKAISYLNGRFDYDVTPSPAITWGAINTFVIGAQYKTVISDNFEGIINNSTIFTTALTTAQVKFISDNPYFMYQIPEELYGYVAGAPPTGNPAWYYNMLRRRN